MMTTNLFTIANVKQLRTYLVLEFYCLSFQTSWCVGVLNSAIFLTVFTIGLSLARFFEGPSEFWGGGLNTRNPRVRHCYLHQQVTLHIPPSLWWSCYVLPSLSLHVKVDRKGLYSFLNLATYVIITILQFFRSETAKRLTDTHYHNEHD